MLLFPLEPVRAQQPNIIISQDATVPGESAYGRYMRLGYAAAQRNDHRVAAGYFRNALAEVPGDEEATIAYWNSVDALTGEAVDGTGTETENDYESYMEIGYDATEQEDYQTALINFRRALLERPGDYYASQAICNIRTYINLGQDPDSPTDVEGLPNACPGDSAYDYYMRLGYAAHQREAYQDATEYFEFALTERPNDRAAIIAYWNAKDALSDPETSTADESSYDRYMRIGYDATEQGDYQTALINFRRALAERPGDSYATQAIRNVKTYINQGQ
ncbi:MAG: tetratricopeptide repeat protein [Okeania sp. SIO2D1]|nr:tetratricopeptide repeat protein [Okeania sp. SIO2D1]